GFFGFGKAGTYQGEILIEVETVTPEGGQDSWWFTGQVLSKKGPIKEGTQVKGFYIGSNGRTDLGWGNEPNKGWVEPA
ncbi:MAG: hypothetical protein Q8O97_01630, partial [bacterium]|nr:hypothetical protein [bacterium]